MRFHRIALAAVGMVALVSGAPEAKGKAITAITTCGQTLITSAYLPQDLYCPGSVGVVVNAGGVTIDLSGHTLRGDRTTGDDGIDAPQDGVIIKNGAIRNFYNGVFAPGFNDIFSNLVTTANKIAGISTGGAAKVVSVASTANDLNGITVFAGSSIASSAASDNGGNGIAVLGSGAKITSTTTSGNAADGIVAEPLATITSATSDGNGLNGIEINGDGAVIKGATTAGNAEYGLSLTSNAASIASTSATADGFDGINVHGNAVVIRSASATGNGGNGIAIVGNEALIRSSRSLNTGLDGIYVGGDAPVITGDQADANGYQGRASDLSGLGIQAENYTTPPTGIDEAGGNDDPTNCNPSSLC
jgi:hypothetical protein